ncbi:hypothetical protein C8Q79DRAFT_426719 [Trametes meyenii]|nr:hypothetical protein C8Q79DRAFT_426719 [Trametes meyenii]
MRSCRQASRKTPNIVRYVQASAYETALPWRAPIFPPSIQPPLGSQQPVPDAPRLERERIDHFPPPDESLASSPMLPRSALRHRFGCGVRSQVCISDASTRWPAPTIRRAGVLTRSLNGCVTAW